MSNTTPISTFNLLRSVQAHGATAEIGWGQCWGKAVTALEILSNSYPDSHHNADLLGDIKEYVDADFWNTCTYAEGWLITFPRSGVPDRPNGPMWYSHGFLLDPDGVVIDPTLGMGVIQHGDTYPNNRIWLPVFTYEAEEALCLPQVPFLAGAHEELGEEHLEPDLLPEFRAVQHEYSMWSYERSRELHQAAFALSS